jgi:putative flippase GtrA
MLINRAEVRFLLVGGFNTALSYVILLGLDYFFPYKVAYGISFAVGVMINFFTHKHITFRSKGKTPRELVKFICVYIVLFFVGLFALHILIDICHLSHWLAFGIQAVCSAVLSFFGHKYISFRASE